jgi:hypothetical protein
MRSQENSIALDTPFSEIWADAQRSRSIFFRTLILETLAPASPQRGCATRPAPSTLTVALILRNRVQHAYRNRRRTILRRLLTSGRSTVTALLMNQRDRLERYAGDRRSDAMESAIDEKQNHHRCGRPI